MSAVVTKPAFFGAGLLALALLLAGGPAAAAPQPVALRFVTAVDGLAKDEIMIVRLRDNSGVHSTADVSFFDAAADKEVRTVSGLIGPGHGMNASFGYAELGTSDPFPGVYATVLFTPADPDDLPATQLSLHVEFFNTRTFRVRDGGTCKSPAEPPNHGSGGADFNCDGGIEVFPVYADRGR